MALVLDEVALSLQKFSNMVFDLTLFKDEWVVAIFALRMSAVAGR